MQVKLSRSSVRIAVATALASMLAACGSKGLTDEELSRFVGPEVGLVSLFVRDTSLEGRELEPSYSKVVRSDGPFHVEVRTQVPDGRPDWNRPARAGETYELVVRNRELVRRDHNGEVVLLTGPLQANAAQWQGYKGQSCAVTSVNTREIASALHRVVEVTCDGNYAPGFVERRVWILAEDLGIVEERLHQVLGAADELQLVERRSLSRTL